MNCNNCGAPLAPGTAACPNCGSGVINQPQQVAQPQQMPAGMPQPSPIPVQQQPAPQPALVGAQPVQPNNNGGSKKGLIIGVVVVLLAAVLGLGGYLVYDKVQENKVREEAKELLEEIEKEEKEEKETEKEIKNNVKVKEVKKLNNGALLLTVENKSSKTVGATVEIEYYDSAKKIIGSKKKYLDMASNTIEYIFINEYAVIEGYETVETSISAMDYSGVVEVKNIKESDLIKNETDEEILIQYKNNTEHEMNLDVICFFYSNNELVYAFNASEYFVPAGNNANLSIYTGDMENITYDRYELHARAEFDVYDD